MSYYILLKYYSNLCNFQNVNNNIKSFDLSTLINSFPLILYLFLCYIITYYLNAFLKEILLVFIERKLEDFRILIIRPFLPKFLLYI